jgi:hypothetical protein
MTKVTSKVNWAEIAESVERDAADTLAVCEIMMDGNWEAIEQRLWDMDTAARDCVYDMIAAEAGEDFFDIVR